MAPEENKRKNPPRSARSKPEASPPAMGTANAPAVAPKKKKANASRPKTKSKTAKKRIASPPESDDEPVPLKMPLKTIPSPQLHPQVRVYYLRMTFDQVDDRIEKIRDELDVLLEDEANEATKAMNCGHDHMSCCLLGIRAERELAFELFDKFAKAARDIEGAFILQSFSAEAHTGTRIAKQDRPQPEAWQINNDEREAVLGLLQLFEKPVVFSGPSEEAVASFTSASVMNAEDESDYATTIENDTDQEAQDDQDVQGSEPSLSPPDSVSNGTPNGDGEAKKALCPAEQRINDIFEGRKPQEIPSKALGTNGRPAGISKAGQKTNKNRDLARILEEHPGTNRHRLPSTPTTEDEDVDMEDAQSPDFDGQEADHGPRY